MHTKITKLLVAAFIMVTHLVLAQTKTVTGVVTDDGDIPLPGVNIVIKGKATGAVTNFDGEYSISAETGDVLLYSFIGYKTKNVPVLDNTTINVKLETDTESLQEVVITAYGIAREKRETTYQTQSVDNELLDISSPNTAASALTGKVAGLQVNVQNNGVNPTTNVVLRGFRSITGNNEAAIVIDGALSTLSAFDDLNPKDIKSVNVLKGATAAALYGSVASNGVLIVETKKGEYGENFKIGVNSTTTFENVAYMPDFQRTNGIGWQGEFNPVENTNWGPKFDGVIRQVGPTFADGSFQELPYSNIENNIKDFYRTGVTLQNTVSFSGGSENSKFYMSIGDQRTDGIVPTEDYKRNTFRVNASQKVGKLELSLNSSYFRDETSIVGPTIGAQDRPLYWFILNTPANIPLTRYKNWRNDLFSSPNGYYNGFYQNPYWAIDTNRDNDKTTRLVGNLSGSYDITKWLNFTARFGLNQSQGTGKEWRDAQTYSGSPRPNAVTSFVEDYEFQSIRYTTDVLLSSSLDITEDFSFKGILGAVNFTQKFRESAYRANNLSVLGFYDVSNGTGALQGGLNNNRDFVNDINRRRYGLFGDFTVGFKNWVFLNFSGRQDYTSTLPKGENDYFYPSVGLSFVLSDAIQQIKDSTPINYLKLTASNSTVYNDLNPFLVNERYTKEASFPFGGVQGFEARTRLVDSSIRNERINSTEFGLNLAMFNNRLTFDGAYFSTKTTDLITDVTPSFASSGRALLTNIGELEGKGVELTLGGTPIKTDNFEWKTSLNYTANETIINEISPGSSEVNIADYGDAGIFAIKGEAFPQIKASSYVRDPQGRVVINPTDGNPLIGGLKSLGKTTPDYVLGFVNTFKYKDFSLSATLDYRTGHVYYSRLGDIMEFTGRSKESISSNRQDFVFPNSVIQTSPGVYVENANIPVSRGNQDFWTNTYNEIKENYVRDATAFKIREIAINYSVPSKFLDNTPITGLRLGVVGRNLLTLLPEENRFSDPEFNNTSGDSNSDNFSDNAVGVSGYRQSPPTRTIGFNINLEF